MVALVVGIVRMELRDDDQAQPSSKQPASARTKPASSADKAKTATQPAETRERESTVPAGARTYTVQAGDTLTSIAEATGVPVARLQQLNPGLQPTALFIGQEIRLR